MKLLNMKNDVKIEAGKNEQGLPQHYLGNNLLPTTLYHEIK